MLRTKRRSRRSSPVSGKTNLCELSDTALFLPLQCLYRVVEQEQAKKELEAALAEVQKEEDKYNARTEVTLGLLHHSPLSSLSPICVQELKSKSETGGMVSRNKAKNELAQHLGEDPLPLRKAKITAEAAVKRAERAKQAAIAAAEKAAEDRKA